MEAALTAFLNNMYETTEYMTEAAEQIRSSIYQASALMDAKEAATFEYQVQKWLGSLYSVGFESTNQLADALGKLAAGDISVLTGGNQGNLLVMAANRANLSTADILAKGLTEGTTNDLLQSMVDYLAEIYQETKNSKVVAQQFASVYGLTAADLKAAANLVRSTETIYNQNLSYGGMMTQLNNMADTLYQRTSMGEMMTNIFDNFNYTMASQIGNSPVMYSIYKIGGMLEDLTGGIALPFVNIFGSGFDLNTTVAQLMQVGAVSGGIISGIGKLIGSLGTGGGFSGSGMLRAFGISNNLSTVSRGTGQGLLTTHSGASMSSSGYVGNEDSSDVKNKTLDDANKDGDSQVASKKEEDEDVKLKTVDEHIIQIYQLLQSVTDGTNLRVTIQENLTIGG
jgi:hypothetical protein